MKWFPNLASLCPSLSLTFLTQLASWLNNDQPAKGLNNGQMPVIRGLIPGQRPCIVSLQEERAETVDRIVLRSSSFMVFRRPWSPPGFGLTKQPEQRGMAAVPISGLTVRYLWGSCGWGGAKETNDTPTYKEFGSNKLTPSRYLSVIGPIWCLEFPVNRLMRFGINSSLRGGTCILSGTPGRKWSPAEPDGNPRDTRPAISRGDNRVRTGHNSSHFYCFVH